MGDPGLPPQSSFKAVLKAFRRLSIRFHPDKNRHKSEEEQRKAAAAYLRILQARDALTHPILRVTSTTTSSHASKIVPGQTTPRRKNLDNDSDESTVGGPPPQNNPWGAPPHRPMTRRNQ